MIAKNLKPGMKIRDHAIVDNEQVGTVESVDETKRGLSRVWLTSGQPLIRNPFTIMDVVED